MWWIFLVPAMAVFTPNNRDELKTAVEACINEDATGLCDTFATSSVPSGQGDGLYGAIGSWDTSKVTTMHDMFNSHFSFNQPLNWDMSQVTSISYMFHSSGYRANFVDWDFSSMVDCSNYIPVFDEFSVVITQGCPDKAYGGRDLTTNTLQELRAMNPAEDRLDTFFTEYEHLGYTSKDLIVSRLTVDDRAADLTSVELSSFVPVGVSMAQLPAEYVASYIDNDLLTKNLMQKTC